MRAFFLLLVLSSLGVTVNSNVNPSSWTLHERRSNTPTGWKLIRRHNSSAVIPLRFALAQSNIDKLDEFLHDVSHPSSSNYGKHWSAGKVTSTFAPSSHSVSAVQDWLLENGIKPQRMKLSASGGWLELKTTVREAEELLKTEYNVYGHETGIEHVASESYHLPEHLTKHVDFVTPTVHFDVRLPKRSGASRSVPLAGFPRSDDGPVIIGDVSNWTYTGQLTDCDTHITPMCLRALYGFEYDPRMPEDNSYGIVEYSPRSYRQEDLNIFANNFAPDLYGVSPVMVSIDGGAYNPTESHSINGESDLDLEFAMNLVTVKQNITLFQVGDMNGGATFNNFLDAIDGPYCTFEGDDDPNVDAIYPDTSPGGYNYPEDCGTAKPANVISTSYGRDEASVTVFYAQRQCAEYGKLGLMGVTVLYSSGDHGVAGSNNYCLNPDGSSTADGTIFNPHFPSTCPYVTSVGATQLSKGSTISDGEVACQDVIRSGGGFSNYFAIPEYQQDAVSAYLENSPPPYPDDIWNSTGQSRAWPDLSANGAHYMTIIDGKFVHEYGTSASTPVVGAMLAMINDARIAAGKSTIGFINPVIYSPEFADGFNDITNGTNPGCGTLGFSASQGWDPVTGLGTPNFPKLLNMWLELD